jgi:hypothetical protein
MDSLKSARLTIRTFIRHRPLPSSTRRILLLLQRCVQNSHHRSEQLHHHDMPKHNSFAVP